MPDNQPKDTGSGRGETNGSASGSEGGQSGPPAISLPKGGGAIRGMGEKFAANPVTGTGSMSVPIATSPGRSGFGPQLSLSYDSGAGNGPFGFGWNLSLPSITRKTDKGLPRYWDAEESDVYILSGTEDLVPEFEKDAAGNWVMKDGKHVVYQKPRTVDGVTYTIRRYRPRIEGLFARIERWTNNTTGETHWRSISKDNITTLYGKDNYSRIFDPAEIPESGDIKDAKPTRIFSWLICESYDDKGNAMVYEYAAENDANVDRTVAHERNRVRTAQRYLKRILYGNRESRLLEPDLSSAEWMFEVVFDYEEGHYKLVDLDPNQPEDEQHRYVHASASEAESWAVRPDPFSSYRSGFEVRSYRRCRRILMFHRFSELGSEPYLVRSTEFDYADLDYLQLPAIRAELAHQGSTRFASFIRSVTQSGFVSDSPMVVQETNGAKYVKYLKKSMPPLEFTYSKAVIQDDVQSLDADSLENLPIGLDGTSYQWVDLDGEGLSGILTEQADAWFYKPNLGEGRFGPLKTVALKPSLAALNSGQQQLLDLAGDGQLDLVALSGPTPGFYERTLDKAWESFRTFRHLPNIPWDDPNLRFVDLNGDGHADVLITEHEVFTWYPSLAESGFAPAEQVRKALDEETGPRLVFADGTQSISLADMCGDGLTDLVRIRNGEVCYWPNLGYGRFGAKVTMVNAPYFDHPDQFDHKGIRLADIDGSGTNDLIYLGREGVDLYFNQSGNRWSHSLRLTQFPQVDKLSAVRTADLFGNGTACLVWSSPLQGDAWRPMRYVDLMGGQKPHLLVKTVNNLGAETHVRYASSTKFYLDDKRKGEPWITRLPFPVHVVERVTTLDHISRNRFASRYTYHHGYFDGEEREFRGFGRVVQWDTETYATLSGEDAPALAEGNDHSEKPTNIDTASHVPPVMTKTWFHTGACFGRQHISNFFAGIGKGDGEYYREPALRGDDAHDTAAKAMLLDDTVLPDDFTLDEEREACRALKGSMLRQEVYALDGTDKESDPYTVTEQNFTIRRLQPKEDNRHGVFLTHAREAINFHYERNPTDPRISHALTLEVDDFGNVLKEASIGYGRRFDTPELVQSEDRKKQRLIHITSTENTFTHSIVDKIDVYRIPLPAETRTYELRKPEQEKSDNGPTTLFHFDALLSHVKQARDGTHDIDYEDIEFTKAKKAATNDVEEENKYFRRIIEQVRTLYRPDDLGLSLNDPLALLPLGTMQAMALPGETYKLAFTPGLLAQVYQGPKADPSLENLLPDPADVLPIDIAAGKAADRGGYVDLDGNGHWWIPAGRVFFSPDTGDTAAQEEIHAQQHFFLPQRYRDPFHTDLVSTETFVAYDDYDLLVKETRDPLGNVVTVSTQDGTPEAVIRINYRVLQPYWVTDPNGNRTKVAFDALGMVVGTAVMGKSTESQGDSLYEFETDLTQTRIDEFYASEDPHDPAPTLLKGATTRTIYDLDRFRRTQKDHPHTSSQWLPAYAATLARETHVSEPTPEEGLKVQISFSYSDGFGREIQTKIQAEPGPLVEGGPVVDPRWIGSGWTIFNNKGKPVRQYEPFFSQLSEKRHQFEFGVQVGVSPILFYDPADRVVATLHPNHTWEKVVFDPWRQETWDVNDTVLLNPRNDEDVKGFFIKPDDTLRLPEADYLPTWYERREGGNLGPYEKAAATKAAAHAGTQTIAYSDTLGRPFLTVADNGDQGKYETRIALDIEGNEREVMDAKGRIVMQYDYDLLGNPIKQASMEAGTRWLLNDVAGNPIRAWDSRSHHTRHSYDALRRPTGLFVSSDGNAEMLAEKTKYGESQNNPEGNNLRGQVYQVFDGAGKVTNQQFDFKGNTLRGQRQLLQAYQTQVNWKQSPTLESEVFTSITRYDALNRPIQVVAPHSNQSGTRFNIIQPVYNEANLLERVDAWLGQDSLPPHQPLLIPETADLNAVKNIDYDAKGQRTRIDYENVSTQYRYDEETFRLIHLETTRTSFSENSNKRIVQKLSYHYDPAGNITHIQDDADIQNVVFFKNRRVEPSNDYVYDAIYRLIEATGREHLGQNGGSLLPPVPSSPTDAPRVGRVHPGDGNAMGEYTERYSYDAVGNILEVEHTAPSGGWSRNYSYAAQSQIENNKTNNRLSSTTVGNNPENENTVNYKHDAHGNMVQMPHLPEMVWDFEDQLQKVDLGGGGKAYYVYDAAGERVRKVVEKNGGILEERIYLGGFEVYRVRNGTTLSLERETLHLMDDTRRIALVETRTQGNDESPAQLIRYQFSNHLGSATLELDNDGKVISYEEYYPYGSTSYQAVDKSIKAAAKRYRYTGKERDEETGLYYHVARYYACWLGRWTAADPAGLVDGANLYHYSRNNPIKLTDPSGQKASDGKVAELHQKNSELNKQHQHWSGVKKKWEKGIQWRDAHPNADAKETETFRKRAEQEISYAKNKLEELREQSQNVSREIKELTQNKEPKESKGFEVDIPKIEFHKLKRVPEVVPSWIKSQALNLEGNISIYAGFARAKDPLIHGSVVKGPTITLWEVRGKYRTDTGTELILYDIEDAPEYFKGTLVSGRVEGLADVKGALTWEYQPKTGVKKGKLMVGLGAPFLEAKVEHERTYSSDPVKTETKISYGLQEEFEETLDFPFNFSIGLQMGGRLQHEITVK